MLHWHVVSTQSLLCLSASPADKHAPLPGPLSHPSFPLFISTAFPTSPGPHLWTSLWGASLMACSNCASAVRRLPGAREDP